MRGKNVCAIVMAMVMVICFSISLAGTETFAKEEELQKNYIIGVSEDSHLKKLEKQYDSAGLINDNGENQLQDN